MCYSYGYKDHSRPPAVSFHIYIWMLCYHLGTKGNTHPQKFMQTYAKMFA